MLSMPSSIVRVNYSLVRDHPRELCDLPAAASYRRTTTFLDSTLCPSRSNRTKYVPAATLAPRDSRAFQVAV